MKKVLLDASVIVKWLSAFDENDLKKAYKLRDDIFKGRCLPIAPDLIFYELANALRYNPHFS